MKQYTALRRLAAFSLIEFILVLALSGILLVGLTSMIEIPRQMVENHESGTPSVADTEVTLSVMDRDIRYATTVRAPTTHRLEVDLADGSTVTYEWSGTPGGPLARTDAQGTVNVVPTVNDVMFRIRTTPMTVGATGEKPLITTTVQTAAFNSFTLLPGFSLGGLVRGLLSVTEIVTHQNISATEYAGIYFQPTALDSDDGAPSVLRVRLRRAGSSDLLLRAWEADPVTKKPIRGTLTATAIIPNASLPASTSTFTIPLTTVKKLNRNKSYFMELRSAGTSLAAQIEGRTLNLENAVAPLNVGLQISANAGLLYRPLGSLLSASQTIFSIEAVKTEVTGAAPTASLVQVPTAVAMALRMITAQGTEDLHASFPLENNLALVTQ